MPHIEGLSTLLTQQVYRHQLILPSPPLEGSGEVFTYPLGTMGPQAQP